MLSIFFPKQVQFFEDIVCYKHYMKSVRIRSFSGPYFPEFGLNTKRYSLFSVFIPNAGKYGPEKLLIWTLFMQWRGMESVAVG